MTSENMPGITGPVSRPDLKNLPASVPETDRFFISITHQLSIFDVTSSLQAGTKPAPTATFRDPIWDMAVP